MHVLLGVAFLDEEDDGENETKDLESGKKATSSLNVDDVVEETLVIEDKAARDLHGVGVAGPVIRNAHRVVGISSVVGSDKAAGAVHGVIGSVAKAAAAERILNALCAIGVVDPFGVEVVLEIASVDLGSDSNTNLSAEDEDDQDEVLSFFFFKVD